VILKGLEIGVGLGGDQAALGFDEAARRSFFFPFLRQQESRPNPPGNEEKA